MGCKTMAANSALLFLEPTHGCCGTRAPQVRIVSVAALAVLCLTKDRYYWLLIGVLWKVPLIRVRAIF